LLLALAMHMLGARFGLDLGGLWRSDTREFMPAGRGDRVVADRKAGFSGGYFTATLMHSAVSARFRSGCGKFLIAIACSFWPARDRPHRRQARCRRYRACSPALPRWASAP